MTLARSLNCKYALGTALMACLVFGGGSARGLAVEAVLQILVVLCATYTLVKLWDNPGSKAGVAFLGLVLVAGLIQLVPLPLSILAPFRPDVFLPSLPETPQSVATVTISLAASRTVQGVIFVLVPIYFFVAASKLDPADLVGLIPFYVVGVLCNLAAAVIQYSLASGVSLGDFLGYSAMVGMFANVNHFTTAMFSSIPIVLYLGIFMRHRAFSTISMILIFLVLLASRSMAGILIGFLIAVVSLASLAWRVRIGGVLVLILTVTLAAYSYGAITQIGAQVVDPEYGRRYFALTTLQAIRENWLLGVGYGAFDMVLPHYEPGEAIHVWYVNHAHNDFLEIWLEGGLGGVLILGAYVTAVLWRAIQVGSLPLQRLALLSILMVLMHSTVDYPLRTMAVAVIFAFFNALLFSDVKTTLVRRKTWQKEEYLLVREDDGQVDNRQAFVDL